MANLSDFFTGAGGAETAVFQEVLASGGAGQNINSGVDEIQTFNTDIRLQSWISRSGNDFTIEAGDYDIIYQDAMDAGGSANIQFWILDSLNVSYGGFKIRATASNQSVNGSWSISISIPSQKVINLIARSSAFINRSGGTVTPTNGDEFFKKITFIKRG